MGIKNLNKFLLNNTLNAITQRHISKYSGKVIVIDTSIYMYQFKQEGTLLQKFASMISLFVTNNVIPIFIFDGKPPEEKSQIVEKRHQERYEARMEFYKIREELENETTDSESTEETVSSCNETETKKELLEELYKKSVRIKREDIAEVKKIMDSNKVQYYDSPIESDPLCSYYVSRGRAFACLSDDTDMFAYGCPHILRNLDINTGILYHYDITRILVELQMTMQEFREMIIMTGGTDYQAKCIRSFETLYYWFKIYKKESQSLHGNKSTYNRHVKYPFYYWMLHHKTEKSWKTKEEFVVNNKDFDKIYNLFSVMRTSVPLKIR